MKIKRIGRLCLSAALYLGATAGSARAAVIKVDYDKDNWNGLGDPFDGSDGLCTLREAVASWYHARLVNYGVGIPKGKKINDCDPGEGDDTIIFDEKLEKIAIDTTNLGAINLSYNTGDFPSSPEGSTVKVQKLTITSGSPSAPFRELSIVRADPQATTSSSFFTMSDGLSDQIEDGRELEITFSGMTFSGGLKDTGNGGVLVTPTSLSLKGILNIKKCKFLNNSAGTHGGAIALNGGKTKIEESLFRENKSGLGALVGDGGALSFGGGEHLIESTLFVDNEAQGGGGGAISCGGGGELTLSKDNFLSNRAHDPAKTSGGGAVMSACDLLQVSQTLFDRNEALSAGVGGGAVYIISYNSNNQLPTFDRCMFLGNTASTVEASPEDCWFQSAPRCKGGAIFSFAHIWVSQSVFRFNAAAGGEGGAIFLNHGNFYPSQITGSMFNYNETLPLDGFIFLNPPEGGAVALGGFGGQHPEANVVGNTIVKNGGMSQVWADEPAYLNLINNIIATDDDTIPVLWGPPQRNCAGNIVVSIANVQSEEGSVNTTCSNAAVAPWANLGASTAGFGFVAADVQNNIAPINVLGWLNNQPFDYYKFAPSIPGLLTGDGFYCTKGQFSYDKDLLGVTRTLDCTIGAIENAP